MNENNGRRRVVITNIVPQIDHGRYPAKTTVGETLTITADIFTDGHDDVAAAILISYGQSGEWEEHRMTFVGNDNWEYAFKPEQIGIYQFKVQGWVDHFSTWQKGLQKKFAAGQQIQVDIEIGALMMQGALANASEADTQKLQMWISMLRAGSAGNIQEVVQLVGSDEVADVMRKNVDKSNANTYPVILAIDVERKKALFSTWYELFPRSASEMPGRHGTFKDVITLLPRIAGMGFDTLYFPPIHPIGYKNRKGKNNSLVADSNDVGSPWAIGNITGGHKAIHPDLGTLADFGALIKAAAGYGIEIAMDIAYQCAPDHPYVEEHPQWFNWRPDGTVQYAENPPKKYEDILPINFETDDWENLWMELKSIIEYWVLQGIYMFRIDNPHTKAFAFWEWMIKEVRKKYPRVIFLAEAFTRPRLMERLAMAGFNQSYTYFTWRNTKAELEEYLTELTCTDMRYYFRPNFWPNTPDILPPILTIGGVNAHIMRLVLAATMSSSYGIYGPVYELGINVPQVGKEEYIDNEKYEIKHWDWNKYTRIREFICKINRIRKQNPALQQTNNIIFAETTNEQIICYVKMDAATGNKLIIVVNLDPFQAQSANVRIPLHKMGMAYDTPYIVKDLLGGDSYHWQNEWNYVQLNPNDVPAHVLRVE